MNAHDRIRIVRDGYDQLGTRFDEWSDEVPRGYRTTFLKEVLKVVPTGSDVLEVGCGPGTDAASLSAGRRYIGVDVSMAQLTIARRHHPHLTLINADVLEIEFRPNSFDAIVAIYVFGHIPAGRIGELFTRTGSWLRPGGWLCASFAVSDNAGAIEPSWLGVEMYFSSLPPERNDRLLRSAGFQIRSAETITEIEPGHGPATFRWVIARSTEESAAG
jgi:cyclopropane fatty-acyl-phospholipid synthase-like methyltransferase